MKIKSIHIKNYKSLKNVEIDNIGNFNVFIGKNNSGKSAIFEIMRFLQLFINNNFDEGVFKREYNINDFSDAKFNKDKPISIELLFDNKIRYKIESDDDVNFTDILYINNTSYWYGNTGPPLNEKGIIKKEGKTEGVIKTKRDPSKGLVISAKSTDTNLNKHISQLKEFLSSMWFLSYHRKVEAERDTSGEHKVDYNGANAIQVLSKIGDEGLDEHNRIIESLRKIFPKVVDSYPRERTKKLLGKVLEYCWKEEKRKFDLNHVGTGLSTVLPIVIEAYNPYSPNTILFIEEPELYLHPDAQRRLFDFLKEVSKERQIFITTHSSVFASSSDRISLYLVKKDDKKTVITPIKEREEFISIKRELGAKNSDLFFYDAIVLIEGDSEEIALPILAEIKGYDLDELGIKLINIKGKDKIKRIREFLRYIKDSDVIPFVILDKNEEVEEKINNLVREGLLKEKEDNSHVWSSGDFEDCFSEEHVIEAMKNIYDGFNMEPEELKQKRDEGKSTSKILRKALYDQGLGDLNKPALGEQLALIIKKNIEENKEREETEPEKVIEKIIKMVK